MAEAYPHLADKRDLILATIAREEAQFARTLDAGTVQLEEALIPLTGEERVIGRRPEDLPAAAPVLPGDVAFRLHDTYGFPVDLTAELAAEYGVTIDRAGFDTALAEQRDRSRSGKKAELARTRRAHVAVQRPSRVAPATASSSATRPRPPQGRIVAIIRDGMELGELTGHGAAEVVLDRTPFYAEGGGQVGDQGAIREPDGSELFTVEDTQKPVGGLIVHRGTLRGRIKVGETVEAVVDAERRAHTMRNHTGTHLLHRALRNVVGDRARQAGSLVHPDYLRFDYPFDRALTDDEKRAIEDEVRAIIRDDRPVSIAFLPMDEAIAQGADAFFDEKYGETVRTIRVQDYSFELCGGTHCRASGQIGGFVITGERSIGSGQRRIEAVTGAAADRLVRERIETLERVAETVGAPSVDRVEDRVSALQDELRETRRRLRAGGGGVPQPADLVARAEEVAPGVRLVAATLPYESMDALKAASKDVRAALGSGVIAMFLDADQPQVWVTVSDDLVDRGLSAGDLVKVAAGPLGAKGGGRPQMAQGMGTRRDGLADAEAAVRSSIAERLGAGG